MRATDAAERVAGRVVHAAGRLIEERDARCAGEHGGDRGALTLAGAQVARIASGEMGESQLGDEQRRDRRSGASPRTVHATSAATVGRCRSAIGFCGRNATRPGRPIHPPGDWAASSPAMVRSRVVLPPPLGPTSATPRPPASRETPSRMGVRAGPVATSLSSHAIVDAAGSDDRRDLRFRRRCGAYRAVAPSATRPPSTASARPSSDAELLEAVFGDDHGGARSRERSRGSKPRERAPSSSSCESGSSSTSRRGRIASTPASARRWRSPPGERRDRPAAEMCDAGLLERLADALRASLPAAWRCSRARTRRHARRSGTRTATRGPETRIRPRWRAPASPW